MRKSIRAAGLAFGLVPAIAFAQGDVLVTGADDRSGGLEIIQPLGSTYASGVVRGSVAKLNLSAGRVVVDSGGATMLIHATPAQLASLNPGDLVEIPYVVYQGRRWVAPEAGGGRTDGEAVFARQGRVTGVVEGMGRARGSLRVGDTTFRLHPAQLEGLLPGEFVHVSFAQIGDHTWVTGIAPASESGVVAEAGAARRSR